jgi:predicted permease
VLDELRRAARALRRAPAFTATATLILALAIGVAAAMTSVFDAMLLRRLPVRDQDRLVVLWGTAPGAAASEMPLLTAQLERFRHTTRTLAGVASFAHFGAADFITADGDQPLHVKEARVSGDFFATLGVRPALGRLLRPEDDVKGAAPVVVISYDLWQRRYGGSPDVIGHTLRAAMFDFDYTVVGVAPPGLAFPAGADYWAPLGVLGYPFVDVVARLAPGATPQTARAELDAFFRAEDAHAGAGRERATGAAVHTLPRLVLGDLRPALVALTAAVALLLVVACVNVGTLLLLRAAGRAPEVAVRRALGASAGRVARMLAAECVLLAAVGGALGLALGAALVRALVALAPPELPRLDVVRAGGVSAGWTVAVTALALAFGVLPLVAWSRGDVASPLRAAGRGGGATRRSQSARRALVAAQMALALVVLAGAGLVARSLARLQSLDLGYATERVAVVQLAFAADEIRDTPRFLSAVDRFVAGVGALPNVVGISPVLVDPFLGTNIFNGRFQVEGRPDLAGDANPFVSMEAVGPGYFRTLGIPLRGRAFTDADREHAPNVVIVSEAAARRYWPGQDPIGRRLKVPTDTNPNAWAAVVGVAGDVHFRTLREATPTVYFPYHQFFTQGIFVVRTRGDLAAALPAIRRAAHDAAPRARLWNARPMGELLAGPLAQPRLSAFLLGAFALTALALAAVGLYGASASAVRQRTRELGVRLALGATPAGLRRGVLGQALAVAALGTALGTVGALAAARLLSALLFEVSPADPLTFAGVVALMLAVALLAAYVPARRATRVDPAEVLRGD